MSEQLAFPGQIEALTSVVASQAEVIKSQAQTIDILSGSRGKSLALNMTISDAWAAYFATLPDMPWRKVAHSTMKRFLAKHGQVRVGDFGPLHWESYRAEAREHYHVTTRNWQLARARTFLNWMVRTDQIVENPLARVKPERKRPKRQTEISPTDEAAIASDLIPVMRVLFIVAIDSAMRKNEIRTLEWTDIDWKARTVSLPAERTKTRRARTAYLTTRAVDALKSLPRYPGCPYVFANPKRLVPYSPVYIGQCFRRAADDNGVKAAPGDGAVRLHDARRSAAIRLVRLGAPIPAVQEILGHEALTTTAMYLSVQRQDVIDAHALLDRATRRGPHRAPGLAKAAGKGSARGHAAG